MGGALNVPASVTVAVVGCGWWATTAHLPAIVADKRAELVALVDPRDDRLQAAAEAFGNPNTYHELEVMLRDVSPEAVVVATPPNGHYEAARLALSSGAHVLIEKPMVLSSSDGVELVALAKRQDRSIIVGYPYLYSPQAMFVRSILRGDVIGELEFASVLFASVVRSLYAGRPEEYKEALSYGLTGPLATSYSDPSVAGGGQGHTQVTHAAALLLWLVGQQVESVSAMTYSGDLPVDLADAASLRFQSGAVATLASTGGVVETQPEMLEYRFFGSSGHVVWDVYAERGTVYTRDSAVPLEASAPVGGYPAGAPVGNLIGLARGEGTNQSPGSLGVATVQVIEGMYRSAATGEHVSVSSAEAIA